jgi:ATP-dependent exoDNAse (exonuclease V) beta subunit
VLRPGLDDLPRAGDDAVDEARLLYVALTRALDRLIMTHGQISDSSRRIHDSISNARQSPDSLS